jgi:hypothetical protein
VPYAYDGHSRDDMNDSEQSTEMLVDNEDAYGVVHDTVVDIIVISEDARIVG